MSTPPPLLLPKSEQRAGVLGEEGRVISAADRRPKGL